MNNVVCYNIFFHESRYLKYGIKIQQKVLAINPTKVMIHYEEH